MLKSLFSRALAVILVVVMLTTQAGVLALAETSAGTIPVSTGFKTAEEELAEVQALLSAMSYKEYLEYHNDEGATDGKDDIVLGYDNIVADKTTTDVLLLTAEELNKVLHDTYDNQIEIVNMTKNVAAKTEQHNIFNTKYIEEFKKDVEEGMADVDRVIYTTASSELTFAFDIQTAGYYNFYVEYLSPSASSSNIERAVMLDDTYPYSETRSVSFVGTWVDEYDERFDRGFLHDINGNEIKPVKAARPTWSSRFVYDTTGYYTEPLKYFLAEGTHTFTINGIKENMVIKSIRVFAYEGEKSYDEVTKEYKANGYKAADAKPFKVQSELALRTSDESIYAITDRTSASNEPQDASKVYLNTIGGTKWQSNGQWIEWEIDVPEDGLYKLSTRFKQSELSGMFVSRRLYIDGKVPFEEANRISFNYASSWQTQFIGEAYQTKKGELKVKPFDFYLTKGKHIIKMEVVLGDMAEILRDVDECMTNINSYYLRIIMLTGASPDIYRDYNFWGLMPDVMEGLAFEAERLYDISARLEKITGQKGEDSVLLDKIARILELMGKDEDNVAPNVAALKDNVGSLGTWIQTARNQPLTLDFVQVQPSDNTELPKADSGFFSGLKYELHSFVMSFISDYNNLGALDMIDKNEDPLQVWMTAGRDQAQIIRNMLTDFTADTGITVNLKLVAAGSLLPSTLAGTGPDVSIQNTTDTCINYAIRDAVLPITDMEGLDEVKQRFSKTAMIPVTLYDEIYGLPETEAFSVLFVRLDIFAELGMEIPRTWDDLYSILPVLQSNNLQAGFPSNLGGTTMLMYQRDEPMYKPALSEEEVVAAGFDASIAPLTEGMAINLDSNVALDCFKEVCEYFTMYAFPLTFDFANRFKSGEMPIAVSTYSSYNQLQIFAPEISGLWKMTTLPGTPTYAVDENGNNIYDENGEKVIENINYNSPSAVTCVMMMRGAKGDEDRSWEFMKWWTDEYAQTTYGNELVALLGPSGQYATANLAALENQPWDPEVLAALKDQFNNLAITPERPGGYIITRYVNFAFVDAYNNHANPVEEMLSQIDAINAELTRKREEFGLPTLEDFKKS